MTVGERCELITAKLKEYGWDAEALYHVKIGDFNPPYATFKLKKDGFIYESRGIELNDIFKIDIDDIVDIIKSSAEEKYCAEGGK